MNSILEQGVLLETPSQKILNFENPNFEALSVWLSKLSSWKAEGIQISISSVFNSQKAIFYWFALCRNSGAESKF